MNSAGRFVMIEQVPQLYVQTTVRFYGRRDMSFVKRSSRKLS